MALTEHHIMQENPMTNNAETNAETTSAAEGQGEAPQVRSWMHNRKGRITGVVLRDDDEWVHIRLLGDHELTYFSASNHGRIDEDGEVLTVRKSFLAEIPAPQKA